MENVVGTRAQFWPRFLGFLLKRKLEVAWRILLLIEGCVVGHCSRAVDLSSSCRWRIASPPQLSIGLHEFLKKLKLFLYTLERLLNDGTFNQSALLEAPWSSVLFWLIVSKGYLSGDVSGDGGQVFVWSRCFPFLFAFVYPLSRLCSMVCSWGGNPLDRWSETRPLSMKDLGKTQFQCLIDRGFEVRGFTISKCTWKNIMARMCLLWVFLLQ